MKRSCYAETSVLQQARVLSEYAASMRHFAMWHAGRYSEDQPFWSQVKECTLMTAKECPKRVLHMSLDVTGSGMEFLPGDAAGVCPANDPSIVDGLLEHLQLDGSLCAPNNPPSMPGCCTQVVLAPSAPPCVLLRIQ